MKKSIFAVIFILALLVMLAGCAKQETQEEEEFKIVASFYPVYIMGLNIVDGIQGVTIENMTSNLTGCLHDYTLTTNDLKKLEHANAYAVLGFGLEERINTTIYKTYPNTNIIGNIEVIENKDLNVDEDGEINEHVWMCIMLYQKQIESICEGLCKLDPEHQEQYLENAVTYLEKLKQREERINHLKEQLEGTRAVLVSTSLEYFLVDLGFDLATIHIHGEEAGLSPEALGKIVNKIKEGNIKYLFVDSVDNLNVAKTLERETGIQIIQLESNLTGLEEKNSYLNAIDSNLSKMKKIIEEM